VPLTRTPNITREKRMLPRPLGAEITSEISFSLYRNLFFLASIPTLCRDYR
jgi:hypothetical protein